MRADRAIDSEELITEAAERLTATRPQVPSEFLLYLFARVPAEDIAPYSAQALADLAASAYEHPPAPRRGEAADIRLIDISVERQGRHSDITAIEVVNANMPFLL